MCGISQARILEWVAVSFCRRWGGTILNRSDEIREVCVWVNVMKIILHFQNIGANIKDFFFNSDLFHTPALFHHLFNSFTSVVIGG